MASPCLHSWGQFAAEVPTAVGKELPKASFHRLRQSSDGTVVSVVLHLWGGTKEFF